MDAIMIGVVGVIIAVIGIFAGPIFSEWLKDRKQRKQTSDKPAKKSLPVAEVRAAIWNVPHSKNQNFKGREKDLQNLREKLKSGQATALTAIHGMGGVGKTELAAEYAYRHMDDYDLVWWVRAEEAETLLSDYAKLASSLELPEKDAKDQLLVRDAVHRWLDEHKGWLLIFDNAENSKSLAEYLPPRRTGHTIITSRNLNWGGRMATLPVDVLEPDEAADFLLERTGEDDRESAES